MQPQNAKQWNLRYLISEAIRKGAKLSLDSNGNIMVAEPNAGYPLLSEQASWPIADGKRRGFNGKQPRTTDGIKYPVTVTTADGRSYVMDRVSSRKVQDTVHRTTAADLAPSNDGNPDA